MIIIIIIIIVYCTCMHADVSGWTAHLMGKANLTIRLLSQASSLYLPLSQTSATILQKSLCWTIRPVNAGCTSYMRVVMLTKFYERTHLPTTPSHQSYLQAPQTSPHSHLLLFQTPSLSPGTLTLFLLSAHHEVPKRVALHHIRCAASTIAVRVRVEVQIRIRVENQTE